MKLDTSSYYPKSPLDDETDLTDDNFAKYGPKERSDSPEQEVSETVEIIPEEPAAEESVDIIVEDGYEEPLPDRPETPAEHAVSVFSNIVSWLTVPVLMPIYGIILILWLSILSYAPLGPRTVFALIVAAINLGIPAVMFPLLRKLGIIGDIGLNTRTERFIPYCIVILCMGGTAWFLYSKGFPMWAVMFYVGGAVTGIIELAVNFRWKISAHAAGVAGLAALMIRMTHEALPLPQLFVWQLIVILLAGLCGSARLWLRRHTLGQILAGYAVGFCSVYFMTMIH